MTTKKTKSQIPEQYQDLVRELNDLHQVAKSKDRFKFRREYEPFIKTYSSKIGEDPNVDFNLAYFHLPKSIEVIAAVGASFGGPIDEHVLLLTNEPTHGLISFIEEIPSLNDAFKYLHSQIDYHSEQRNKQVTSDLICKYIYQSVVLRVMVEKWVEASGSDNLITIMKNQKYIALKEHTGNAIGGLL